MPCPISLLFINLHGSEYLVAAQLCPYGGETGGGWGSRGREKFTTRSTAEELGRLRAREHGGLRVTGFQHPRNTKGESPKGRGATGWVRWNSWPLR